MLVRPSLFSSSRRLYKGGLSTLVLVLLPHHSSLTSSPQHAQTPHSSQPRPACYSLPCQQPSTIPSIVANGHRPPNQPCFTFKESWSTSPTVSRFGSSTDNVVLTRVSSMRRSWLGCQSRRSRCPLKTSGLADQDLTSLILLHTGSQVSSHRFSQRRTNTEPFADAYNNHDEWGGRPGARISGRGTRS